jgi:hypothetical protein
MSGQDEEKALTYAHVFSESEPRSTRSLTRLLWGPLIVISTAVTRVYGLGFRLWDKPGNGSPGESASADKFRRIQCTATDPLK